MPNPTLIRLVAFPLILFVMTAHASVSRYFVVSVINDYVLAEGSGKPTALTVDPIRVGGNSSAPAGGRNAVFIFPLPKLGPLTNLLSASVAFTVRSSVSAPAFNGDLWAIGIQSNISVAQIGWAACRLAS